MKTKLIIIALLAVCFIIGGYFYYRHNYVETVMLSEIVGHTDNDLVNIFVNLGDFDTGLTRHDINHLKSNKDYWIDRIKEVEATTDPQLREDANIKLLADMMEDPTMKKVCQIITARGLGFLLNMLQTAF